MFLEKVKTTVEKYRLLKPGDKVLAGVSGGPDSLALLTALVSLRKDFGVALSAAYVDHGLRLAAARREAALVREAGRRFGIPVVVLKAPVRRKGGESLESAARDARYRALLGLAVKKGANLLALGHSQDDQAETVLMWLLRGAGTTGLAGIPPVRRVSFPSNGKGKSRNLKIIRPFIQVSRKEITAFLRAHKMKPLLDISNRSDHFLRNRIRRELLPLLEKRYSPEVRRHLAQLAEILRSDVEWMEGQAARLVKKTVRMTLSGARVNRERLKSEPTSLRRCVLRQVVGKMQGNCHGFAFRHWELLDQMLLNGRGKAADLPHGFRVEFSDGGRLLLRRKEL